MMPFVIWQGIEGSRFLTFELPCHFSITMHRRYDVIPPLVEIAKSAIKEKVIRVIISTLRVSP